ncbi:hypothetical protein IW262DRAFT_1362420 [Armillaria fumosa]|nr:hypothetical protein IW262DRAFT_1362420 [Armillaria fumosa]
MRTTMGCKKCVASYPRGIVFSSLSLLLVHTPPFDRSSLLRIMINFWSIISGTMIALLSKNIVNESGATAFLPAISSPILCCRQVTEGPLFLVNTCDKHHAITLRVDHSYAYGLRCPQSVGVGYFRRFINDRAGFFLQSCQRGTRTMPRLGSFRPKREFERTQKIRT